MSAAHTSAGLTVEDVRTYRHQVEEAVSFVQDRVADVPRLGVVLGTGLTPVAEAVTVESSLSFEEIPHFPSATGETHPGRLTVGTVENVPVVVLEGRPHLYDGSTPHRVAFPLRVLALAGVDTVLLSGVAGGVSSQLGRSDLMLVTDHINFQGVNPLVGPNVDDWGPRFPDMTEPYDPGLRRWAEEVALEEGINLQKGVYLAALGPNLATRAEYRMIRSLGADAVGMSLVPEVLVARHMSVRVMAVAVITDRSWPGAAESVSVDDLVETVEAARPPFRRLLTGVVGTMESEDTAV